MSGRSTLGLISRVFAVGAALWLVAAPATAFEALDGRIQAHGFFESQLRTMSADYGEDWDVSQWYQVFNLELEVDLLQDPIGPLDLVSGYVRGEVRFDCVYSRGCGMFRSVNAYGDRSKSLPRRLSNAKLRTPTGSVEKPFSANGEDADYERRSGDNTDPVGLNLVAGFSTLAGSAGADQAVGNPTGNSDCLGTFASATTAGTRSVECASLTGGDLGPGDGVFGTDGNVSVNDDPFEYVFDRFKEFRFTQVNVRGGGVAGLPTAAFGPWLPKNFVEENGSIADRINPFDKSERSPVLAAAVYNTQFDSRFLGKFSKGADPTVAAEVALARTMSLNGAVRASQRSRGNGANPFRPIPIYTARNAGRGNDRARGHYIPTQSLQDENRRFDNPQFNFREAERQWNRGASQQDEKELKEAYLDIEMFDSRLWMRIGKQSVVWGKTELFRTTDQFNPQDLALASLPSLEESRISLWAFRGVWSFYEVGPFEDVRAEVAFNFDDYESADLGACGEAYTPNLVCSLTFGMFAHGTAGLGVAGVERPEKPWNSLKGWEVGGRVEWRWDRFSFALMDFYGYNDTPTLKRISSFERNVDPDTGRPRQRNNRGACTKSAKSNRGSQEADCLKNGPTLRKAIAKPNAALDTFRASTIVNTGLDTDGDGRPDTPSKTARLVDGRCETLLASVGKKDPTFIANCFGPNKARADNDRNALDNHHVNQQVFAMICSTTIGFSSLDATACAQSVFGSTTIAAAGLAISQLIAGAMAGSSQANDAFAGVVNEGVRMPLLVLTQNDGEFSNGNTDCRGSFAFYGSSGAPAPESARPNCGGASRADILGLGAAGGAFSYNLLSLAGTDGQAINQYLTPHQESLLGCGPFWGNNCDDDGVDLMNMEASAITQAMVGFEGTIKGWRTDGALSSFTKEDRKSVRRAGNVDRATGLTRQPGTVGFQGGPVCSPGNLVGNSKARKLREGRRLPGCYGLKSDGVTFQKAYNVKRDGDPRGTRLVTTGSGAPIAGPRAFSLNTDPGVHPFTGQPWQNEMAAVSWNFQMILVTQSAQFTGPISRLADNGFNLQDRTDRAFGFSPKTGEFLDGKCSFLQPQNCATPEALFAVIGTTRSTVEAGGNGRYGRRTFTWHSGGEAVLTYTKRNVLGFSADMAEDVTKSNWGMEATWIEGLQFGDANQYDGSSEADTFNLTISIDRPTFINFLNANRTFFFNTQWFFQYVSGYKQGFASNGPFNVLGVFSVSTGYYQDRLLPSVVFVYDVQSVSGAALPQVTYRFNEAFSVTIGAAVFMGREELADRPINPLGGVANLQGKRRNDVAVENGLSVVRDRDEVFLRLRYTF